ncbi:MAG: glycoside hydrolase family 3 C-terminal domain-containing protein, partial [Armatimonadetes bacterium]|nr:glycoside hydrolase family 3 C-terminal domain-containing protein [Armatimonadota bacterium]
MKENLYEGKIEELLSEMPIDEKIAQLGSVWVYELFENGRLSVDKMKELIGNGIGEITRLSASGLPPKDNAHLANEIQKFLKENTRPGIPAIFHEECLSGYMAKGATIFPQMIGMASSWDPELLREITSIIREQMRSVGAHQGLAPILDVARDPRWGRTEETFGEDLYLISTMGTHYIQGLQGEDLKNGVMATAKHFVAYGISEGGMNWAPAHVSPREMKEIFLLPFEIAVRAAKVASLMNAYHEIDGIPCGASKELLTEILRKEWGFYGIVVSDYFAIDMLSDYHHIVSDKEEAAKLALKAGIDIELPSKNCYDTPLKMALKEGLISEDFINESVRRVLRTKFKLGLFESPYVNVDDVSKVFDIPEQRELALKAAKESIVLLKNDNDILPLSKKVKSIAVIGPNASDERNLLSDYSYPAHMETLIEMAQGEGAFDTPVPESADIDKTSVPIVSVLEGIKKKVSQHTTVRYAKGCDVLDDSKEGFDEVIRIARESDVAIVVVGDRSGLTLSCTTGESRDRADLNLPGVQEELVRTIYETGTPVVVVLVNGRPLSIEWIAEHIPAILEVWLPGEEGG